MSYSIPCGRTTGHGESCVVGYLCGACEEVLRLRQGIERLRYTTMTLVPKQMIIERIYRDCNLLLGVKDDG